jgi:hypothetical protein
MSSNDSKSSGKPKPSRKELQTQQRKTLASLDQLCGKVDLGAKLDKKYRARLHEFHRSNPQSPCIPVLENQILELVDMSKLARDKYTKEGKRLQVIQTALDESSSKSDQEGDEDQGQSKRMEEVKAELDGRIKKQGGRLEETRGDVSKLKETVDGHTVQIAKHGEDIEALKQGPAAVDEESNPSASSSSEGAGGQNLEV